MLREGPARRHLDMAKVPPSPAHTSEAPTPTEARRVVEGRLLFVISPPRAGSTLLQRMLGSHPAILTHPEPHIITPLAHLGFWDKVDKAPYDHVNSAEAIRAFVEGLPRKDQDYFDAARAYTDILYGRLLDQSGKERFLDKTPAYALVLPFLERLYPAAKYLVLTRHPLAVFSSYANSFFDGRWDAAHSFNPILERYVPAMARFLRESSTPRLHLRYEELTRAPEQHLDRAFRFLGLPPAPEAANYGAHYSGKTAGPGDPIGVGRHSRPVTDSIEKWAAELAGDGRKLRLAEQMIARLTDQDLETWGFPRDTLFEPLERSGGTAPPRRVLNRYTLQRRIFLALRHRIDERPHGKLVRRVRYYCDVLLRQ